MLKKYDNYINESTNENNLTIICNVNEVNILEISDKDSINDAIKSQFDWIESIQLNDYKKIGDDLYEFNITVDYNILKITDKTNTEDAVRSELSHLEQSGIKLEEIK